MWIVCEMWQIGNLEEVIIDNVSNCCIGSLIYLGQQTFDRNLDDQDKRLYLFIVHGLEEDFLPMFIMFKDGKVLMGKLNLIGYAIFSSFFTFDHHHVWFMA